MNNQIKYGCHETPERPYSSMSSQDKSKGSDYNNLATLHCRFKPIMTVIGNRTSTHSKSIERI